MKTVTRTIHNNAQKAIHAEHKKCEVDVEAIKRR